MRLIDELWSTSHTLVTPHLHITLHPEASSAKTLAGVKHRIAHQSKETLSEMSKHAGELARFDSTSPHYSSLQIKFNHDL